ncbi:MAG TPA: porin family protein [Pseudomonadales bacterium]|jgi:opacity protein-like surface antigen
MTFAHKALVAAVALAASSFGMAEDNSNFYGFVDAGQAQIDGHASYSRLTHYAVYGTDGLDEHNTTQYSLGVGMNFNEYIGMELSYNNYGEISDGYDTPGFVPGNPASINPAVDDFLDTRVEDIMSVGLALVVGTPVGDNFSTYAKVGVEVWEASVRGISLQTPVSIADDSHDTYNGIDYFYGFGFKLDMTDNLSLRNEYVWHKMKDEGLELDTQSITLGLVYTF